MTYHELVKKVQTALAKADASKVEEHIAVQVNVTGEAEGAFYMEISGGVLYVAPYDYNDRDALLTADGAEVLALAQGKLQMDAAIAEGKVACEGNYDKVMALAATIPVKKAAARKKAVKAEAAAVETVEVVAAETAETAETVETAEQPKKRGRKPAAAKAETAAEQSKKRGRKSAAAKKADAPADEKKPAAKKTTRKSTKTK